MKKGLLGIFIVFIASGCSKEIKEDYSTDISKYTEEVMLERANVINEDALKDKVEREEVVVSKEEKRIEEDNIIDEDSIDYKIHKGRIDCINTSLCNDMTKEIEKEFAGSIKDIDYIAVKNKNNQILGYFINYLFKDYDYYDYETCISKGEYLKQMLTNRDVSYKCNDSVLSITISKEEGSDE